MLGLGLGVDKSRGGFGKFQYLSGLPSFVPSEYSLAFDASGAETLADYEANTLYFRDSNFNRVGATFSRTTTATRVNKQGLIESVAANVPRIDYTDGSAKLLMEPSRTNLITYSEEFDNSSIWSLSRTSAFGSGSVINDVVAPDGNVSADYIQQESGQTSGGGAFTQVSYVTGTTYTISVFAKKKEQQFLRLGAAIGTSGTAVFCNFDLENGIIGTPDSGVTPSIKKHPNGWYKCSVTIQSQITSIRNTFFYQANGLNQTTANPLDGIYLWGAQLEEGSYPTSYIPTAGSAVTRNADAAAATGISANIGQSEGTAYNEVLIKQPVGLGSQTFFSINIGASLFLNCVINNAGRVLYDFYVNGSYTFSIFPATVLTAGRHKIAVGYKAGDYALYVDGVQLGTSTDATVYSTTKDRVNINNVLYGGNETAILFPTRLTNTELAQLTS